MDNRSPRSTAKALIIRDEHLLVLQMHNEAEGLFYALPGGGQERGEPLPAALQRECLEEVGVIVTVGVLRFVYESILPTPERIHHQVDHIFACSIAADAVPTPGSVPDTEQVGVAWLPLARLHDYTLYPAPLTAALALGEDAPVYINPLRSPQRQER